MLFFYSLRYKKVLVKRKNKVVTAQKKAKVVYFQGCINKYVNQSDKNATLNLLDMLNYDVVKITNICCGLPYLSDCLHNKFDKNAKKIVNSIPDDIDYIVCSCDSCYETLKKIDKISSKLVRIDELLKLNQYKIKDNDNDNDINTYYYKPLYRKEDCYLPQNIKILNTNGTCSLIENFFVLKYPKIAKKIYESSFYKNNELNNKTLIFTSMLDYYFFKFLQKKEKKYIKVFSFSEYVKFDII